MSRIETTFSKCKFEGRKALITFITAGDPDKETSLEVLKSLPDAGADIIELGMPFADPTCKPTRSQKRCKYEPNA